MSFCRGHEDARANRKMGIEVCGFESRCARLGARRKLAGGNIQFSIFLTSDG